VGQSATFVDSTTPVVHIEEGYTARLLHGAQLEIFRVARNFWSVISQCRCEHRDGAVCSSTTTHVCRSGTARLFGLRRCSSVRNGGIRP